MSTLGYAAEGNRTATPSGHDPYRRLPALLYELLLEERPEDVRARLAEALRLLVPHGTLRIVEVEPQLLSAALARGASPEGALERLRPAPVGVLALPLVAHGVVLGRMDVGPVRGATFGPREESFLRRFAELAAVALHNAHSRAELQRLAFTDPLTGLANRRRLADDLAVRARAGQALSLLLLDSDGLKAVNDILGYEAGDRLIVAIARALEAELGEGELAARLGGDEFVGVLPGTGEDEARNRAARLSASLDTLPLPAEVARLFRGVSVGVVASGPRDTPDELLRRAAADMHRRKRERKSGGGTAGSSFGPPLR